jgi:uncharacterized lipoprotein YddW (UPF0748 family)
MLLSLLVALVLFSMVTAGETGEPSVRAAWVTRWAFKSPEDVVRIFEGLDSVGVNTVFFQARGACDALYRSSIEPWSPLLTGRLGADPGWDPLGLALEEGGRKGISVHAWVNVFPAWPVSPGGEPPPASLPVHVYESHPEWLANDRRGRVMPLLKEDARHSYAFLSPTHEGVQEHIERVIADLLEHYEVHGLHLDYVRFPDSSYSYDPRSLVVYEIEGREGKTSYADWRRENLTTFVARLTAVAKAVRPDLEMSAAVWQRIEMGREVYFQDGPEWVRSGILDFVVPMIYTADPAVFDRRLEAYVDEVGPDRVVAGIGPYLEGFTDSTVAREMTMAEERGVLGISVFNSDYALDYGSTIRALWLEEH